MAITKKELLQAFREAVSMEFAEIPRDSLKIKFVFSKDFEDRMNSLFRKETDKSEISVLKHIK